MSIFKKNKELNINDNQEAISNVLEFSPKKYDDIEPIANAIMAKKTVKLYLNETVINDKKRIIDFLCGVGFALEIEIKKIGLDTYQFNI